MSMWKIRSVLKKYVSRDVDSGGVQRDVIVEFPTGTAQKARDN